MLAWHWWLIAALLLLLLELLGTGFFAFAFGLAALAAMVVAWLDVGVTWQWFTFALAAALLAPLLKWLFRRFAPSQRTSFLAGESRRQQGEIVQLASGELRLKLEGDLFPVRSASDASLTVGARVQVRRFDGITAIID
ncbi:membrane protein implicated in regulation of membrane protease activity [Oceanisphaera litoralis]|uniref:NfeD family protein n=1 Tax=Oceanisphaera litoralis TaxID=225144 RepID=UPI001957582E|nr:NfeD family protein [Oceanisphaera litoralis]MBM7454712.1 membrane protein implicated in regulation of membrane protease activity [Oceanisphaera litoralis]